MNCGGNTNDTHKGIYVTIGEIQTPNLPPSLGTLLHVKLKDEKTISTRIKSIKKNHFGWLSVMYLYYDNDFIK